MENKKVKMMIVIFVVLAFICGTLFLFFAGEDCEKNGSQKDSGRDNSYFTTEIDTIETTAVISTEMIASQEYDAKGKLSITFIDEDEKPVENVGVQILDEKDNVVETIYSDTNGNAVSEYLLTGTYYYQQISVPDTMVIDPRKYEFNIIKSMQIVEEICMLEWK